MSNPELLLNIDFVKFPRDPAVLLTYADDALSVGVIQTPYDGKILVASFNRELLNIGIPMNPTFLVAAMDIIIAKHQKQASELAVHILNSWAKLKTGQGLTQAKFTEFVKDSPVGKPQFMKLGGGALSLMEQVKSAGEFTHIRNKGFMVPLLPIIEKKRSEIA